MDSFDDFEQNTAKAQTSGKTDKKCPSCGAVISYAPQSQKLICDYCEYEEELKSGDKEPEVVLEIPLENANDNANKNWGAEKKSVTCKSCGAVSIYDAKHISDVCPFCDSNLVTENEQQDSMAPQGICPFTVDQAKAKKLFKEWLSDIWFAPNDLKKKAVDGAITGIYAPYWSFDTIVLARYVGEYGVDHKETDGDGNSETVTEWFPCQGKIKHFFDDFIQPASKKENANLIKSVEPFDTAHCKPYKPEYVAGFSAENYSVGLDESWKIVKNKIEKDKIDAIIKKDISKHNKCDRTKVKSKELKFTKNKFKYLLLPLWISSYRYNGEVYHFVVNGQSGKLSGDHPYSWIKICFAILCVIAILAFFYMMTTN